MRAILFIASIVVGALCAEEYLPPLEGMQGLTIFYGSPEQLQLIRSYEDTPGVDFVRIDDSSVDVLVTADQVKLLKAFLHEHGIVYTVTVQDMKQTVLEEYIAQQVARKVEAKIHHSPRGALPFTYYPDANEINEYLEYVSKAHSDIATLIDIGTSYEGRPMKALKISSNGNGKPAIFIDAGIHAREWIAPATALYIIDQMVANRTNRNLLENLDWYIVPLVNPDGYQFTHSNTANRLWRKTRSISTSSSCRGVDGNRNFDMAWMTTGASSNPCSEKYAGPAPFSEPETQNVRDFVLARKGNIKFYLTLHSYGQYILYPWGYTTALPNNEEELRNLATDCVNAISSIRKTKYTYGTSANHLYPSSGGSDDWAMDKAGADLSYTYELPGGMHGFVLPPSEIKAVGTETFEAIKVIYRYVNLKHGARY